MSEELAKCGIYNDSVNDEYQRMECLKETLKRFSEDGFGGMASPIAIVNIADTFFQYVKEGKKSDAK